MRPYLRQRIRILSLLMVSAGCVIGCDAPIEGFQSNAIFAKRLELSESIDMEQPLKDAGDAVDLMFGTPDQPIWPEELDPEGLVSLDRLQRAAGAVRSDEEGNHFGLYREHCVVCHGISGDGLGPSAALLNPYPRDLRHGKFKFKSTKIGTRPRREDLKKTLVQGLVGTSMPSFGLLVDEDIEGLVDYVVYLSVRGEVERRLLNDAAIELDIEDGERILDRSIEESEPGEFQEQLSLVRDVAGGVIERWADAQMQERAVVEPPAGHPIRGAEGSSRSAAEAIANGQRLFQGNVASCAFCHGMEAKGDGQQNNFDDWTRDWTAYAGLDPTNRDELRPMLDLGALKPRNILPRNLTRGLYRGGSTAEDLYLRIVNGIEGTPMPAAPLKSNNPQGLTEDEVWDLVIYLMSLRENALDLEATSENGAQGKESSDE